MTRYIIRRGVSALVALFGVTVLAFCTTALAPGNPAEVLLGTDATPEKVHNLTHTMGLDKPLPLRYFYWLRQILHGNMGESILNHQRVASLLLPALKVTLELSLSGLFLAVLFAIPIGVWVAAHNERWWARPIMLLVTLGVSIPGFWVGLMLIEVFAVKLRLLPVGGFVSFTHDPVGNIKSMILPAATLVFWLGPPLVRFMRATTVGVLRENYVTTARSKGMGTRRLLARHVSPNAAIPTITYIGLQLGTLIGGAIITEVVFTLPGMGQLGMNAILVRDYPVVQGVVLVFAAGYIVVNFVVDLLYLLIDPRVRVE